MLATNIECTLTNIVQLKLRREMLTSVLRALVKNPIKESFYGKRKKKQLMFWQFFLISHKSDVKTFSKWILNQCPKGTR